MNRKRKDIFRLLLSDIAIFIFFVFVVSDLINMHLRLIYHIDLFASQNIIQGVVKKVKDNKVKIKAFEATIFWADNSFLSLSKNIHFLHNIYFKQFSLSYSAKYISRRNPRAPPTLS